MVIQLQTVAPNDVITSVVTLETTINRIYDDARRAMERGAAENERVRCVSWDSPFFVKVYAEPEP